MKIARTFACDGYYFILSTLNQKRYALFYDKYTLSMFNLYFNFVIVSPAHF